MRRVLVPLLAAALLLAPALAAAEAGKGRGRGGAIPVGAFEVEEASRAATGEHVSFSYSDTGIQDFRASNRTLYSISVEAEEDDRGPSGDHGIRVDGAALRVRTQAYRFVAHDTATAASQMEADGVITVAFAEGVVLAREADDRVRFSFGDVTGVLRGEQLATSGRDVTSQDDVLVILDKPRGAGDQDHYRDLGRAIARGQVGAEATINLADDASVTADVISYGNVTMTTTRAERGNITVVIEGYGVEGRVLVLNVDGRVVGADRAENLAIMMDNVSISPATNLTDILDPDDDGYSPEYYVVFDPQVEAFQLIVTVPHYSVYTLSVTTFLEIVKPSVVVGILAGTALLVPAGLVLFRRR